MTEQDCQILVQFWAQRATRNHPIVCPQPRHLYGSTVYGITIEWSQVARIQISIKCIQSVGGFTSTVVNKAGMCLEVRFIGGDIMLVIKIVANRQQGCVYQSCKFVSHRKGFINNEEIPLFNKQSR